MVTMLGAAGALTLGLTLAAWRAHPIHAGRIELDVTPSGAVSVVVRVYQDDFTPGAGLREIGPYLDRVLIVTDARGARVSLRTTGIVTEGDRLRVAMTGTAIGPVSHGRIALTLLQEKFADQVNVVDARIQGRRAQLVFLRGDGPQLLP